STPTPLPSLQLRTEEPGKYTRLAVSVAMSLRDELEFQGFVAMRPSILEPVLGRRQLQHESACCYRLPGRPHTGRHSLAQDNDAEPGSEDEVREEHVLDPSLRFPGNLIGVEHQQRWSRLSA